MGAGLWYRCRAEHHRNKTQPRAAFQLDALVKQFDDEQPSAAHRLLLIHSTGYPARFHLEHESGVRMMQMGMVSTAHEKFKKLRMWGDAVECLMAAGRNVEAVDMIKELLEQAPTPRLWCCLADLEKEPKYWEKAWELSGKRFARAQRSLGRHHFMKGDFSAAIDSFRAALQINPLFSQTWFTMGCAQMRLERWEDAYATFSRCLAVDDENAEAWGNLAAVHVQRKCLREARTCIGEAVRRSRQNWRMWESFLGICMQLRDIQGCILSLKQFAEQDQASRISDRVLGVLTKAVVADADGLSDTRTGRAFVPQLQKLFQIITSVVASEPSYWRFYAVLQEALGQKAEAAESRLKESRHVKLWEEKDPAKFSSQLEDLLECYQVLENLLADPDVKQGLDAQSFAYLVRNSARQLDQRVDAVGDLPPWNDTHQAIRAMSDRLDAPVSG